MRQTGGRTPDRCLPQDAASVQSNYGATHLRTALVRRFSCCSRK